MFSAMVSISFGSDIYINEDSTNPASLAHYEIEPNTALEYLLAEDSDSPVILIYFLKVIASYLFQTLFK